LTDAQVTPDLGTTLGMSQVGLSFPTFPAHKCSELNSWLSFIKAWVADHLSVMPKRKKTKAKAAGNKKKTKVYDPSQIAGVGAVLARGQGQPSKRAPVQEVSDDARSTSDDDEMSDSDDEDYSQADEESSDDEGEYGRQVLHPPPGLAVPPAHDDADAEVPVTRKEMRNLLRQSRKTQELSKKVGQTS
jgi:hypothetical protein